MRPKPLTSKLTLGERVAKDTRRAAQRLAYPFQAN